MAQLRTAYAHCRSEPIFVDPPLAPRMLCAISSGCFVIVEPKISTHEDEKLFLYRLCARPKYFPNKMFAFRNCAACLTCYRPAVYNEESYSSVSTDGVMHSRKKKRHNFLTLGWIARYYLAPTGSNDLTTYRYLKLITRKQK